MAAERYQEYMSEHCRDAVYAHRKIALQDDYGQDSVR